MVATTAITARTMPNIFVIISSSCSFNRSIWFLFSGRRLLLLILLVMYICYQWAPHLIRRRSIDSPNTGGTIIQNPFRFRIWIRKTGSCRFCDVQYAPSFFRTRHLLRELWYPKRGLWYWLKYNEPNYYEKQNRLAGPYFFMHATTTSRTYRVPANIKKWSCRIKRGADWCQTV